VEVSVLVEGLAPRDVSDAGVREVGEELRRPDGEVLAAEGNPSEGVDIESLERPYAGLLALCGYVPADLLVERLGE
jgi:hypothetical protein